jgi:hypothetical protein
MASSAFSKALANKKESIAKMREVEAKVFTLPNIPKGNYTLAVDAEAGVTENKGVPYVKFNWTIQDEGEYFGKSSNTIFWLDGEDDDRVDNEFKYLAKAFMALLDLAEVNVDDPQDIEQLVDMVNNDKVYCEASIQPWESASGKKGFRVYFNKKVAVEAA